MSLRAWWHLRGCKRVGPRARTDGAPSIGGGARIFIGADFSLSSRPVASHLVTGPSGRLEIGDGVVIGQGAAIAAHELIRIGPRTRIGDFVVIADTDFHVAGDKSAEPPKAPVLIGADVRIGSRVTVLRGATVGDGAEIAAGSVVSGNVEPRTRVAGVPARKVHFGDTIRSLTYGVPETLVAGVVRRTLGLEADPPADAGPEQIPGWDSLGSLKLLLALEEEFRVSLKEEVVARARSVADLELAVREARHSDW